MQLITHQLTNNTVSNACMVEGECNFFGRTCQSRVSRFKNVWRTAATKTVNTFLIVATDQYWRLIRSMSSSKSMATHTATVILDHRIVPCETSDFLHTVGGLQLVNKFFCTVGGLLGLKQIKKTAYRCECNRSICKYRKRLSQTNGMNSLKAGISAVYFSDNWCMRTALHCSSLQYPRLVSL